jgi:hypothetical protein
VNTPRARPSRLARLCALGVLLLAVVALRRIPRPVSLSLSDTPFDNGPVRSVAPAFALLRTAATAIPPGSTVLARGTLANPKADTYFHRAAVALLPNQVVLPAAVWFRPTKLEEEASYVILLGEAADLPGFSLFLRTAGGSIWKRRAP